MPDDRSSKSKPSNERFNPRIFEDVCAIRIVDRSGETGPALEPGMLSGRPKLPKR